MVTLKKMVAEAEEQAGVEGFSADQKGEELRKAAEAGATERAKLLIAAGADPEWKEPVSAARVPPPTASPRGWAHASLHPP